MENQIVIIYTDEQLALKLAVEFKKSNDDELDNLIIAERYYEFLKSKKQNK